MWSTSEAKLKRHGWVLWTDGAYVARTAARRNGAFRSRSVKDAIMRSPISCGSGQLTMCDVRQAVTEANGPNLPGRDGWRQDDPPSLPGDRLRETVVACQRPRPKPTPHPEKIV